MAENMYRALWSVIVAILVNVIVSYMTRPKTTAELTGLVYGATELPVEEPVPFYKNEYFWLVIAIILFLALNIYFW
jgi:solute:Na+ symporter, SSS family